MLHEVRLSFVCAFMESITATDKTGLPTDRKVDERVVPPDALLKIGIDTFRLESGEDGKGGHSRSESGGQARKPAP